MGRMGDGARQVSGGRLSAVERLIRSRDGRAIGVLTSSPLGWRAVAFSGSSSEDIDAAMDACQPLFERFAEARRRAKEWREGRGLRLVSEVRR